MTLIATWYSEGRRAQHPPDPVGLLFDASAGRPYCEVSLEYPALRGGRGLSTAARWSSIAPIGGERNPKVVGLPTRPSRAGGIFCTPLNLQFLTAHRIEQSATPEELDELGFHDEEPSADAKHHTLTELGDDAEHSHGKIEPTVLRTLDAAIARLSLVVQSTITDRPMKQCRI